MIPRSNLERGELPTYPEDVRKRGVEGTVVVEVVISTEGKVESARAVSGPEELRASALAAASAWQFPPIREHGEPVRMQGPMAFQFIARNGQVRRVT